MSTTAILTCFYEKYNPEKMDTIPKIVKQFTGREEKLYSSLQKKYGEDPRLLFKASPPPAASPSLSFDAAAPPAPSHRRSRDLVVSLDLLYKRQVFLAIIG
jgi:hypothetical protein